MLLLLFVCLFVCFVCLFIFSPHSRCFNLILNCCCYTLGIKDPEEKKKAMMELFESLPTPNRHTSIYLLDHLRRYSALHTCCIAAMKFKQGRGEKKQMQHDSFLTFTSCGIWMLFKKFSVIVPKVLKRRVIRSEDSSLARKRKIVARVVAHCS